MSGAAVRESVDLDKSLAQGPADNLRQKTIRGGAVTLCTQVASFVLQMSSTMVLARVLAPGDYGLMAMATVLTGMLSVFRDGGLSTATLQHANITQEQVSTLFWVNCGLGCLFGMITLGCAPVLAYVFGEPRLIGITAALAIPFVLNALTVQHQALLGRQMRFTALAIVDLASMVGGLIIAIAMALNGFGYWSLVGLSIGGALVRVIAVAMTMPWFPGKPTRGSGISSMLRFGGYLTMSNVLNYLFRNSDNALIGWYWGAGPLGLYSKAYGLLMLPLNQVNSPVCAVALPAMSRVQADADRFRRVFLGGYACVASIVLPAIGCLAVFAREVVLVVLGPQWEEAVILFRLLAPAALLGALLNPCGWIFIAGGHPDRQFRFGILWSALIISAFCVGLKFGPEGVAVGYSIMSCFLAVPLWIYAFRGTSLRLRDLIEVLKGPVTSAFLGCLAGTCAKVYWSPMSSPILQLLFGGTIVLGTYLLVLLLVFRKWPFYRELFSQLLPKR